MMIVNKGINKFVPVSWASNSCVVLILEVTGGAELQTAPLSMLCGRRLFYWEYRFYWCHLQINFHLHLQ